MVLIKDTLLENKKTDILLEGHKIVKISAGIDNPECGSLKIIDARNTAALPSLFNGHTHSPMVLMRGYGDDLPLFQWLSENIFPVEARISEEDLYWGYRLAFIEMIKTGTGFFNDMYLQPEIAVAALEEIPMKAQINYPVIDGLNGKSVKQQTEACKEFFKNISRPYGVQVGIHAHSIYINSEESLKWIRDFSAENNLKVHIHLSETGKEVKDCKEAHSGMSPVEYLESIGFLNERVIAAHTVWLSEKDMDILARYNVTAVHNPVSNMKLASGGTFPYRGLKDRGVNILLGTDGAASNNNLDLFEEMKIAALLQKHESGEPTLMTAAEIFKIAAQNGADFFKTGGGIISEGTEADIMLVDTSDVSMVPITNLVSNIVYSASGSTVKTLISGGTVLMENRNIKDEELIKENALKRASILLQQ